MAEIKGISFFRSYYEAGQLLDVEQRHRLYDCIFEFAFEGVAPSFDGDRMLELAWTLVQPNLQKSVDNALNGKKGGRPKKPEQE